jgi:hypothetical protein
MSRDGLRERAITDREQENGYELDFWTEMRLRVTRIKRKKPNIFGYAIYDLLVPNPGITVRWVRQIIHEYCLGPYEVSRRTNRHGIRVAGAGKRRAAALK